MLDAFSNWVGALDDSTGGAVHIALVAILVPIIWGPVWRVMADPNWQPSNPFRRRKKG